jgi:hypothetical protein
MCLCLADLAADAADPGSVPSLFRLMPTDTAKRCQPASSEIPAQRHDGRYRYQHQKSELYYDV